MLYNRTLEEQLELYNFHQTKYFFNMHKHTLLNVKEKDFAVWLNFIFKKTIEDPDYQWFIVQTLSSISFNISSYLSHPEYKLLYMTYDVHRARDIWNEILHDAPNYPPKVRKKIYHLIDNIYPQEQSKLLISHFQHSCHEEHSM